MKDQTGKTLLEFLTKKHYFSIESLKEILNPFVKGQRAQANTLPEEVSQRGGASLESAPEAVDPDSQLAQLLVEQKEITREQLEIALQDQRRTGLPLWRTLVNLQFATPRQITEAFKHKMYHPFAGSHEQILKEALLKTGLVREEQISEIYEERKKVGKSLIQILKEKNLGDEEIMTKALAQHLNIPYIDILKLEIDEKTLNSIPESFIHDHHILPFHQEGNELHIATADPLNLSFLDDISLITGCTIKLFLCHAADLEKALEIFYGEGEKLREVKEETLLMERQRTAVLSAEAPNTSIVNLVNSILEGAIRARATDVHLEPQQPEMRVRYRIDGMLYDVMTISPSLQPGVISRIKVLAEMDITERRNPQDGRMTLNIHSYDYHMRVATLPAKRGEKLVIRIFAETNVFRGLKQLGPDEEDQEVIRQLIAKPYGMILVTGPIGSGKTTTLYAALNELDILTNNVVTIEDPVEYLLPGINQMEVDAKTGMTFASGLRAILRQDADVLMIGEIRDTETAKIAVRAALTGQQIFSTLHTVDTPSAITTLRNLDLQPFLIASALNGVIAQRLVRKICPSCKKEYRPSPLLLEQLGIPENEDAVFFFGEGCKECY
ncbi:MAG: Flp pilus assembly complex ATPase component TadA, partial [Candidatus Tectomicrobia bacterium]|nr:Flp pilus assembly complex ATPase component TadA [Candidatus Tectomicrobia bacterium]